MGLLERRLGDLRRLRTQHNLLLTFYKDIENLEQRVNASPCAFSASQHFDHALRSMLDKRGESPIDWQSGLAAVMSPETVMVETIFGFKVALSGRDDWRYFVDGYNSFEASETILILRAADQTDCFFDIGANVGYYSFLVAVSTGQSIPCYAFEPVSDVNSRLVMGIQANNLEESVHALRLAVGPAEEEVTISINRYGSGGNAIISGSSFADERMESGFSEKIPSVTLDGFLRQNDLNPSNGLVKIDVEGYETQILDGAADFFSSPQAPILLIETWRDSRIGRRGNDIKVLSKLAGWGYEIMGIRKFAPFQPLLYRALQRGVLRRSRNGNYMAFHRRHKHLRKWFQLPDSGEILLSQRRIDNVASFQEKSIESAKRYVRKLASSMGAFPQADAGALPNWEETTKRLWATFEMDVRSTEGSNQLRLMVRLKRLAGPVWAIIYDPVVAWLRRMN